MKTFKLKELFTIAIVLLIFQSCADDNEIILSNENSTDELSNSTAQLITDWSNLWVTTDQYSIGMRPNSIARSLAYIHLTGYETAVPFMDDYSSNSNRLSELNIDTSELEPNVNIDIALNTAYAIAMEHFSKLFKLKTGISPTAYKNQN